MQSKLDVINVLLHNFLFLMLILSASYLDHRGAYAIAQLGFCPSSLAIRQNVNEFTSALAARSVGESAPVYERLLLMLGAKV